MSYRSSHLSAAGLPRLATAALAVTALCLGTPSLLAQSGSNQSGSNQSGSNQSGSNQTEELANESDGAPKQDKPDLSASEEAVTSADGRSSGDQSMDPSKCPVIGSGMDTRPTRAGAYRSPTDSAHRSKRLPTP